GHGPSSNVRTTSLSRKKSCCLKFSKPKPGPPVVSISTALETPSALGFLQEELDVPTGLALVGFEKISGVMADGDRGAAASVGPDLSLSAIVPVVTTSGSAIFAG